jgi:hypothetical protein
MRTEITSWEQAKDHCAVALGKVVRIHSGKSPSQLTILLQRIDKSRLKMNVRSNKSKTMSSTPTISTTISLDHDGTYVFFEVASAEVKIVNRKIVILT